MNLEAIVGIRLSGYRSSHNMVMHSRFGFHIDSIAEVLAKFKEKQKISVKGFHFHLNSYSSVDRAYAIGQLVESVCQARSLGFSEIDFIDIGGGFLVRYLKSADEWDTFNTNLEKAVLGEIEPITYMNNSLHLLNVNGNLARSGTLYPYFNDTPRHQHDHSHHTHE
jgi:diaminopimelate decarboxylase